MSQTNPQNSLLEAMRNINSVEAASFSALTQAVTSLQGIDVSALKSASETFKMSELSALTQAVKSLQSIDVSALKSPSKTFKMSEISALTQAVKPLQGIDMSVLKLAGETVKMPELSALRNIQKTIESINTSDLGVNATALRPTRHRRKMLPSMKQEPSNLVASVQDIGLKVRASRKTMGMTQKNFADLAGVGRRFVSELERGKSTLEFDRVLKVCTAAGIDIFATSRVSK